jgi:hypothetical protein
LPDNAQQGSELELETAGRDREEKYFSENLQAAVLN